MCMVPRTVEARSTPIAEEAVTQLADVRKPFLARTAWRWLLVPALIVVLFGVGDIARGSAADPAIVEGLTGVTIDELEAMSPEAATVIDLQARGNGLTLVGMGLALTSIIVFGFKQWNRWAWFAAWILPVWAIGVSTMMLLVDRPETAPLPPPMVSGPIFFVYCVFWLAVSYQGFTRESPVATA